MKLQLLLIVFFVPFFGYSQCPATLTTNGTRLFMNYAIAGDLTNAQAVFGNSPTLTYNSTNYITQVQPASLRYRNNPAAPAGTFTGVDVGSSSISLSLLAGGTLTCNYEDGAFLGPLPVELISFKVEKNDQEVILKWSTASEQNNQHFEIERSENDGTFKTIGRVNGTGNSYETIDYSFVDSEVNSGQYYYRLKQVDFDGKSDYSDVVSIRMINEDEIKLFPTAIKKGEFLNIRSADELTYKVYSPSLQLVKFDFQNESSFNTAQLNEGIYFVQFSNGITKRFIVIE